jgi:hypothetical protein
MKRAVDGNEKQNGNEAEKCLSTKPPPHGQLLQLVTLRR